MADQRDPAKHGSCCQHGSGHSHHRHDHSDRAGASSGENATGVKDPVCGMTVNPATAKHHHTHAGHTYYFCAARCREKFIANPEQYLSPIAKEPDASPPGTIYTCPMHPEIRQVGPGSCPICGMALEPEVATADAAPNPELADMTRRLWIALVLTLPVFALEMGGHLTGLQHSLGGQTSNWIQLLLATPVVLWAGWPFFERGWASIKTMNLNMFTLIAMGTGVAWIYSVVGTLWPGLFPASMRGHDGSVAVYFEAAAVITVLVLVGQVLELRAREHTSSAIRALLNLTPKRARRVRADGTDEDVDLDHIAVGDRLRVRPGEHVPVDGEILEGRSAIDESMVTGESMPATKTVGDNVIGGTTNQSGGFLMRADKIGRDTVLARIVQMVAEAQRSRAPIQRLVDQVAAWFVPTVIAVALVAFGAWSIWGPEPRFTYGLIAAVSVLIIACPCALGLATPMSIMVGVGRGAKSGVLIKNAEALERMEKIDTLLVDKTGTLTEDRLVLRHVHALPSIDAARSRGVAASLAAWSQHPLSRALAEAGDAVEVPWQDVREEAGQGLQARDDQGRCWQLGSWAWVGQGQADPAPEARVWLACDGAVQAGFVFDEAVREGAFDALQALKAQGLHLTLLSGDDPARAAAMAQRLGLDEAIGRASPEDKLARVQAAQAAGRKVGMVGDGINDAPVLARADVSLAMGQGALVARTQADAVIVSNRLADLVRARVVSVRTMAIVRQNLVWAAVYNGSCIPLALAGWLPPWAAGLGMATSSLLVIVNALRASR